MWLSIFDFKKKNLWFDLEGKRRGGGGIWTIVYYPPPGTRAFDLKNKNTAVLDVGPWKVSLLGNATFHTQEQENE